MANPIKVARRRSGLTEEEAAEAAGVTVEEIRAYEMNEAQPTAEITRRLWDAYEAANPDLADFRRQYE